MLPEYLKKYKRDNKLALDVALFTQYNSDQFVMDYCEDHHVSEQRLEQIYDGNNSAYNEREREHCTEIMSALYSFNVLSCDDLSD